MRVYERNEQYNFYHPEDMKRIIDYLNEHGKILVKHSTIEHLYYEFSDEYCAGWLIVDDDRLAEFEEWLSDYEIDI